MQTNEQDIPEQVAEFTQTLIDATGAQYRSGIVKLQQLRKTNNLVNIWYGYMLRESAKARLEARGLIQLPKGSFLRWLEPDWFDKAVMTGAIYQDEEGRWQPQYTQIEIQVPIASKGMRQKTETKTIVDTKAFDHWWEMYTSFKRKPVVNRPEPGVTLEEALQILNPATGGDSHG